ncbi:MAG: hypothetical protein HKN89_04780 [Eudoraea sp.]|nr:hypothetical protein [Eudoraea sp.]
MESHLHYSIMIRYFLLFTAIIYLTACEDFTGKADHQLNIQEIDSISFWLAEAKNSKNPIAYRRDILTKASNAINSDSHDTLKLDYYSQLSLIYSVFQDSTSFRKYSTLYQNLAKKLGNDKDLAYSYWDLGAFLDKLSIRDSSFYYYRSAYSLFNKIGDIKNSGNMLYRMAIQQQKARAYIESEKTTYEAINLIEPIKDTIQLFLCYNNLGSVTKELKEYDRSLEFYNKAEEYLNIMGEENRLRYTRTLNNNRGNVYKEQEMWEEAIPYFEAALQYENLESDLPRSYAQTLNNLTISRFLNGDTTNVLDDLFKALKIFTLEDDNPGISLVSYNLALYYANIGNKKEAVFYAADAIEKAELSSNYKRKLEALKLLGWIDAQNDLYFDEYVMLSERLQDEERSIRDKFARIERETDEALAEAEALEKDRRLILGISLGLILLSIASLIIIFQRIRVQRLRFQQQQQEANQEIFNLMLSQKQKMEEGKQSEQKRISEELHDGVLGALNGIRMVLLGLNGKNDDSAVAMRGDAIDKLKGVQEEIRSISHELNDTAYQKFNNFINSIQDLIRETEASSYLSIKLNYDEDVDWDALSGEIKINLYRIIQESIQNVVKHAQANQIELNLIPWDNMLKITISDDGKGFDTRKIKKGIGHRNIKSRVEKVNGSWNIESTIGKGSNITVILPYEKELSHANMLVDEGVDLQQIKKN